MKSEIELLFQMFKLFGTPNKTFCNDLTTLEMFPKKPPVFKRGDEFGKKLEKLNKYEREVLVAMVNLDQEERSNASELLKFRYFN